MRSLAATSSLRGISTKQIVMATDADQVRAGACSAIVHLFAIQHECTRLTVDMVVFWHTVPAHISTQVEGVAILTSGCLIYIFLSQLGSSSPLFFATENMVEVEALLQMYLMDKRFLDPRRPKGKPTMEDQAEMLPPFEPELPMVAEYVASHRRTVPRITGAYSLVHSCLHCVLQTFTIVGSHLYPILLL